MTTSENTRSKAWASFSMQVECALAVSGPDYGLTKFLKHPRRELAYALVVLDQQNLARTQRAHVCGGAPSLSDLSEGNICSRQEDGEGGARADLAAHIDLASGLLGEAIDLAQAKARALVNRLGREEGLEDSCQGVRQHPRAGVGRSRQRGNHPWPPHGPGRRGRRRPPRR